MTQFGMVPMVIGQVESPQPQQRTPPDVYLVAMCDVLGFSDLVKNSSLDTVYAKFLTLRAQVRSFQNMRGYKSRSAGSVVVTDGVVFSDTILFWAPAEGAMEALPMSLAFLLPQTMSSTPLRVGFACGECVIDSENDIYIGQPIIDAYLTEQAQQWMGGAYHRSCWEMLPGFLDRLRHWSTAVRYTVPVKTGYKGDPLEYALNWPLLAIDDVSSTLTEQEQGAPAKDKVKWQNARAFYDANRR